MAQPRASTSRFSLDDWDLLAPLSSRELASVSRISQASAVKPVPLHLRVAVEDVRPTTPAGTTRPTRTLAGALDSPSSRPGSARGRDRRGKTPALVDQDPLRPAQAIATTQQFHDWFSSVEASLEREQEQVYVEYLGELVAHLGTCDSVLGSLDEARGLLSEMEANYRLVDENSRSLQLACEHMLEEQRHLLEVTDAIGARLEYFRELEKATRMLNLPGEDLVLQDDFLNLLDRLDACLDYLKLNRDFRDAEIYLIRYQQCLTRSMTLIKMYFVSTVRKLANDVQDRVQGKDLSDAAFDALLYAKFSQPAPTLRILLFELEKRALVDPDEYGSLLSECYAVWFAARGSLFGPRLNEEVRRMDPATAELVKLAKAGCAYLRGVCAQEWTLFREFFGGGEDEAYRFLESLCDSLYDSLRPRILHEPRLDALCELCAVLYALMALDTASPAADADDDDEGGGGELRFAVLLQTILQDAQTRLVFRAQAVVQSEVLHFAPSLADLDYPAIIVRSPGLRALWEEPVAVGPGGGGGGGEDGAKRFRAPSEASQTTWYPTLKRTVWVLSRLNAYVNDAVFEDFAGEAVALCRKSLVDASAQIAAQAPAVEGQTAQDKEADGTLFLVRHLLLLKEMVRSVDLVHIERAADFSSVTEALGGLLTGGNLFNPRALVELASRSMPSWTETMTDAKLDLDVALKRACESLIRSSSTALTASLRSFLDQCTAFLSSPSPLARGGLVEQVWASPERVLELHLAFRDGLEERTTGVVRRMRVFLVEEKTVGVLLPPLWEDVLETYSTYYNLIRSEYGFATSSSLSAPDEVRAVVERAGRSAA